MLTLLLMHDIINFVAANQHNENAVVAELADAHGSGPCGLTPRGGSSPLDRITLTGKKPLSFLLEIQRLLCLSRICKGLLITLADEGIELYLKV